MLGIGVMVLGAYGAADASKSEDPGGEHPGEAIGHDKHHNPHDPRYLYGDDDEDDAGPCDAALGWQQEDGCDPANDLPGAESDDFISQIKDYAGARYAGQWVDRTESRRPVLEIGFVNKTHGDQEFLDSITGRNKQVRAVGRLFSSAELDAVTGAVTSQPAQSMLGSDDRTNRVTLFVLEADVEATRADAFRDIRASRDPLVIAALDKLHGHPESPGKAIDRLFRVVSWSGFKNAETRTTYPTHKGGRALRIDQGNGLAQTCTSAYTVETNASGKAAGLTAGHCARGYLVGGISVGSHYLARPGLNPYRETQVSDADAVRYSLPSSSDRDDNIFVNGASRRNRDLEAPRHTVESLKTAGKVCFQGVTSDNNNCGGILYRNQNVADDEKRVVRHVYIMNYPCQGGDSGGPVYSVRGDGSAKAAGVVKGSVNGSWCGFSQIGYALSATDTHLYYR